MISILIKRLVFIYDIFYRITTFVVSTVANGVIFFQVVYYWNSGSKSGKQKKQQEKKTAIKAKAKKDK